MSALVTINTFSNVDPPWSIPNLDANFAALKAAFANQNNFSNYIADTGAANAYVVTPALGTSGTLAAGLLLLFKAANANTGASTLNYNGLGAKAILNLDGSVLLANQILAGSLVMVAYDGTQFILLNQAVAAGFWTPSVGGSATYTTQVGTFKSIGGLTFITCNLQINAIGTGSTTTISGLPQANIAQPTSITVTQTTSLSSAVVSIAGLVGSGATTIQLLSRAAAATGDSATGVIGNGTLIQLSGFYRTS